MSTLLYVILLIEIFLNKAYRNCDHNNIQYAGFLVCKKTLGELLNTPPPLPHALLLMKKRAMFDSG